MDGVLIDYCGLKLYVPHQHYSSSSLLTTGLNPEMYVQDIFRRMIKPGSVVIDLGANIGIHTICLAAIVENSGIVYAVEADIDNAVCLRHSIIASGLSNVRLLPIAAAEKTGVLSMLSSSQTNSAFSHLASTSASKVAVTARLDALIFDKIDFIKIDVEGAEMLAFRGMEGIMARSRPVVLSEYSPNYMFDCLGVDVSAEYLNFFISRGYEIFHVDYDGNLHAKANIAEVTAARDKAYFDHRHGHIELLFVPNQFRGAL